MKTPSIKKGIALFLALWATVAFGADPAQIRKDIARKLLAFYELEVPTRDGGTQKFAVTILETFDHEVFDADLPLGESLRTEQLQRQVLKGQVIQIVQDWYERHLAAEGGGELTPEFLKSLRGDQSIHNGCNTLVVISNPDDFTDIQALLRVAKRSPGSPELPVERQFGWMLKKLPRDDYRKVPNNAVKIWSFRHEVPHFMVVQNLPVFSGDTVELKHYSAVRRKDVDLTALLFHVAQEVGALSIIGQRVGKALNLPVPGALITPGHFVAESDNPMVIQQLMGFGFRLHDSMPNAIRPDKVAQILVGTEEQFGTGFFEWNQNRRNSWQLPNARLNERDDAHFLQKLFGNRCSQQLARSLQRLNDRTQKILERAIRASTR